MTHIGRYQVLSELGRGGFGIVYLAVDPNLAGRRVAIKLMTAAHDPSLRARFRNEAVAAASLRHPAIVTIIEYGEEDGTPFIVMEYVEGTDLGKRLDEGPPLTQFQKVSILEQIANGLHAAHQHNIIHRDIKPPNIMLLPDGSVKIMDFGIARLTESQSTRLTSANVMVGSLPYMAPEQFLQGTSDVLTDIWSFGVLSYELLTGTRPFHAPDLPQTIYRITSVNPPPVHEVVSACPEELSDIVARAMAKSRDDRYQSLEDVGFDLKSVLSSLRTTEANHILKAAEGHLAAGRLDSALQSVREALEVDSQLRSARMLREKLTKELQKRKLRARVEELVGKAEEARTRGDLAGAIVHLENAVKTDPSDETAARQLEELRKEQQQIERAQRLLSAAHHHLDRGELEAALQSLGEARSLAPGLPGLEGVQLRVDAEHDRRADEQQKARVARMVATLEECLRAGDLNRAAEAFRVAQRECPGEPALEKVGARIQEAIAARAREAEAQAARARREAEAESERRRLAEEEARRQREAQELARQREEARQQEEARARAEQLQREEQARAQREEQFRIEARNTEIAAVRKLLAEGRLDAAIDRITSLLTRYPGDPTLLLLLGEADSLRRRLAEEQLAAAQAKKKAEEEARRALERELQLQREREAQREREREAELARAREREAQLAREREELERRRLELERSRLEQPPPPPIPVQQAAAKPRSRSWMLAVVPVAIVAAAGVYFATRPTAPTQSVPPAAFSVAPNELRFRVEAGSPSASRSVRVEGATEPVRVGGPEWLRIETSRQDGSVLVNLTASGDLPAGQHDGVATIIDASGRSQSVRLVVEVRPPDPIALRVDHGDLRFTVEAPGQRLAVSSPNRAVEFEVRSLPSWLRVDRPRARTPAQLTFTALATGMPPGRYTDEILLAPLNQSGPQRSVEVALTIERPAGTKPPPSTGPVTTRPATDSPPVRPVEPPKPQPVEPAPITRKGWNGDFSGQLRWTGTLAPGATLDLTRGSPLQGSTKFPWFFEDTRVQVRVVSPSGAIVIEAQPSRANSWGLIRVRNTGSEPVQQFILSWQIPE